MSDELRARLRANEQRRRAERGLSKRDEIASSLAEVLGYTVSAEDFLSVEESDALMEAVGERVKGTEPHATWADLTPLVFGGLAAWAEATESMTAYLSFDGTYSTGMPLVRIAPLLRNLARFWKPPANSLDLVLATVGAADGLWLRWDDRIVDLWAWGQFTPTMR